jgi:hypothetical protein
MNFLIHGYMLNRLKNVCFVHSDSIQRVSRKTDTAYINTHK